MENKNNKSKKKIVPRGNPILHGNNAIIDPEKKLISDYQFYSVTPANTGKGDSTLPISDEASVILAKCEVDINHK